MSVLIVFIQKAIVQGICILYGALGEIMTEKSGNLNLGIPGIMYMGGRKSNRKCLYGKNPGIV